MSAALPTDANPNGYVKLPARLVEWLVLGLLATGGGYYGSASADKTAALERQIDRLEASVHEYHRDMERDLDTKIEREVELAGRAGGRARPGPAGDPVTRLPPDPGVPMTASPFVNIPREAADAFRDENKRLAIEAAERVLRQVAAGELTLEDAQGTLVDAVSGAIDATATLVDVAVALPSPAEELSDLVIHQGADVLKGLAAKPIAQALAALDDAIGYNPRRAARRLAEAIEADLEDGTVGDDRVRRVYRLARRIVNRSPALAIQLGLRFDGDDQLYVDGQRWGAPPRRFDGPDVATWGTPSLA
jgi:hypothetical protein